MYAKPGVNSLRLTRLPQEVVESGNSPVTVEISFTLSKGRKKTKKQPAVDTEPKKRPKKRRAEEVPAEVAGLSKKARMFSPTLAETRSNLEDGEIPDSDDSGHGHGLGVEDDLAFYEDLEQAILEQRESDDQDEAVENGIKSYSVYDSSDEEVGWRTRI